MIQNNFHNQSSYSSNTPPNQFNLTIIQKLVSIYKLWHEFLPHFPKDSKYTLGTKIDSAFLEVIENIIKAGYSDKLEKQIFLKKSSVKLDLLKFFLQLSWEIKSLDNKKYISLSEKLDEVGRMLGGWIKSLK
jgi:four helix bundle protein